MPARSEPTNASARPAVSVAVRKTVKLSIGGQLVRSESGRTVGVTLASGVPCEVPVASRKDARDAVKAARGSLGGWSKRDPYNRGQILYRVAEMLDGRGAEFSDLLCDSGGAVMDAIDVLVHYAGWCDKIDTVLGSVNPVSGPYASVTSVRPCGVVASVLARPDHDPDAEGTPSGLGAAFVEFVECVAASMATSNTTVVAVSVDLAVAALTFAEVLMHSDVPAGVVNILTDTDPAVAQTLAAHSGVDALDVSCCAPGGTNDGHELELAACESIKRMRRLGASRDPLSRLAWQIERQTVWQPVAR